MQNKAVTTDSLTSINKAADANNRLDSGALTLEGKPTKLYVGFSGPKGPLEAVYREVLGRMGYEVISSENDAQIVITNKVAQSQNYLRAGKHVVHLTGEKNSGLFDAASTNLQQHPEYRERYHCIDNLQGILCLLSTLSEIEASLSSKELHLPAGSLDLSSVLSQSQIRGKKILVLDNSAHNRSAASYQFGATNSVAVFESYIDAVNVLKRDSFDLALIDLLMPPENYLLGAQAFARVVGSEFPAGVFVALQAAKRQVKEIYIVSDSNHHDHPATAIIESILTTPLHCESGSRITFCSARTVTCEGHAAAVKDWDRSITPHISQS